MKYNTNKVLANIDGTPIKQPGGEAITFRSAAVAALVQAQAPAGEEKYELFKLALQIQSAAEDVELRAEDVVRLKRIIGETMPTVIVGRMYEQLDQR